MISVKVYNRQLVPTAKWPITSGSVGLPVEFEFDEDWDGISRIAVFRGSGAAIDVPLLGSDSCVVPAEVLTEYGDNLLIGVYGENGAGNTVIPTVWGNAGLIKEGTEPSEISPSDPEPDWTAQVIAAADTALRKATAVEDAAERGDFDGYSPAAEVEQTAGGAILRVTDKRGTTTAELHNGEDGGTGPKGDPFTYEDFTAEQLEALRGPAGVSPTVATEEIPGGYRVTITDKNGVHSWELLNGKDGKDGEDGQDGQDGYTPRLGVDYFNGKDGKDGADGAPGKDGADGFSPTVWTEEIEGGHRVNTFDGVRRQWFDVPDGKDGTPGQDGKDGKDGKDGQDAVIDATLTQEGQAADSAVVGAALAQQKSAIEDLSALVDRKAGMLVDTASGAIASFVPDSTIPDLLGLTVDIEPQQDLHGYDHPWPSGGGANLFDIDNPFITAATADYLTTYAPKVEDGKFYNGGKLGEAAGASIAIPVEAESTYTVQFVINGENATWEVRAVTLNGNVWTSNTVLATNQSAPLTGAVTVTVTIPSGKTHLFVACYSATKQGSWETNIQIEKGSTATAYSPYSNICPISGWDAVEVERTGKSIAPFLTDSLTATADMNGNGNWCDIWKVPDRTKTYTYAVYIDNRNAVDKSRATIWLKGEDGVSYTDGVARGGNEIAAGGAGYSTVTVDMSTVPNTYYLVPGLTLKKNGIASNPLLELGSTATDFKPFAGNRYTIQLGQTVYGGTLTISEDGSVNALVDRAMVTFTGADSENWGLYATYPSHFQIVVSPPNKKNASISETNAISNAYTARAAMSNPNASVQQGVFSADGNRIRIKDITCTTVAEFKAKLQSMLNGLQVCYVLDTPVTIQLDPVAISAIAGQQNNVWADAGDVTVEFAADIKHYIDSKIAAAVAALS